MVSRKKKISQGRKKIAIEKIASEEARHVCFSKRRNGIFTKATDLATLCGAEIVIVVSSPAGNPYSFGSPGVNEVIDHFLSGTNEEPGSSANNNTIPGQLRMNLVREFNQKCMELSRQMDLSKAKKSMLETQLKTLIQSYPICQLAEGIEGLELGELTKVEECLVGLKGRLDARINEMMRSGGASSSNSMTFVNPRVMNQFAYEANQPSSSNSTTLIINARVMNQFAYQANQSFFARNFCYGHGFY